MVRTMARGLALSAAAVMIAATAQRAPATTLTFNTVATSLNRPVFVTHAPDSTNRLFIVEKRGVIKILDLTTGTVNPTLFLDIDSLVYTGISGGEERGMLGLAFHPNYATNGYFYVNYINNSSDTVIARYHVSADPNVADPTSAMILLTIDQPYSNHKGGWMGFGPDGYLYDAQGDGGSQHDPQSRGQDLNVQLGKILRIDVDGAVPYAAPPANPFVGVDGDDLIWAYGLRNPWRDSFDRLTGDFWIGDVGQDDHEEIDFQPRGAPGGRNYGWNCREGFSSHDSDLDCTDLSAIEPVSDYPHLAASGLHGNAVIGGYVYRGCQIPDARGRYFFGDNGGGFIASGKLVNGVLTDIRSEFTASALTSFGEGPDGELYIATGTSASSSSVRRIVASGPVGPAPPNDYDSDGTISITDYDYFERCATPPEGSFTDCLCDVFDSDTDGDIDFADFVSLQRAIH